MSPRRQNRPQLRTLGIKCLSLEIGQRSVTFSYEMVNAYVKSTLLPVCHTGHKMKK